MPPVKMMCRITAKYPRAVAAILYFTFIAFSIVQRVIIELRCGLRIHDAGKVITRGNCV
jgi:hypothetical protein